MYFDGDTYNENNFDDFDNVNNNSIHNDNDI